MSTTRTAARRSLLGIGTLLTAAALAIGPAALASAEDAGSPAVDLTAAASGGTPRGAGLVGAAGTTDFDAFLAAMVEDSAEYWSAQLDDWAPTYGTGTWQPLSYLILDSGESAPSGCDDGSGGAAVAGDPDELTGASPAFFCEADMTVYLSSPWLHDHLWITAGDPDASDFGVAYAVAHEVAHAVQHDLGITNAEGATTVAPRELQADCLAGVWSDAKGDEGRLEGDDIPEAVAAAASVGDYEFTEGGHHGTPEQRAAAFMVGYGSGDAGSCTLHLLGAM